MIHTYRLAGEHATALIPLGSSPETVHAGLHQDEDHPNLGRALFYYSVADEEDRGVSTMVWEQRNTEVADTSELRLDGPIRRRSSLRRLLTGV